MGVQWGHALWRGEKRDRRILLGHGGDDENQNPVHNGRDPEFPARKHASFRGERVDSGEIPFEFVIGDRLLPPARYIVDVASGTGPSVTAIRIVDQKETKSGK